MPDGKELFLNWLKEVEMDENVDWLVLGDFNLIRNQENRNKPGENVAEMLKFNEVISSLGLNEISLQGRRFTWSNMQPSPLLESWTGCSLLKIGHLPTPTLLQKLWI